MKHNLIEDKGILVVRPDDALSTEDFASLTKEADAYIEKNGSLNGLAIITDSFPGWENPAGFLSHIKFVRDHHKQISKVAIVSNSKILNALPSVANHFVTAEVKDFDQEDDAMKWLA